MKAIETATAYTRPIQSFVRYFGSAEPIAATATLFVVNAEGWALTCAHVARQLGEADTICARYAQYKAEFAGAKGKAREKHLRKELVKKYGYNKRTVVEFSNRFVNCVDTLTGWEGWAHPELDIALIRFNGFGSLGVTSFPTFAASGADLKQGKVLCRLGYPFPEFSNFAYDASIDETSWVASGRQDTPLFPIDGMVTRHLGKDPNTITGFELSTPGLRGQSGGPVFDTEGVVWGMQSATNHLDLAFDVDMTVMREGVKKRVAESAFLHVGHALHVDALKAFMRQHSVSFQEG